MRTIGRATRFAALGLIAVIPFPAEAAPPSIRPDRASIAVDVMPSGETATARLMGNGHIDDDGGPTGRF